MPRESNLWHKLTAIGTLVLATTGALALWFAWGQIRESHDQARIQHLDDLVRRFDESPVIDARRKLARSRIDVKHDCLFPLKPDEPPDGMETLLDFFDYVGLLEKRGYLDKTDVWDQFSFYLIDFYADAQPVILESQKTDGPAVWENVTLLVRDMQKVDIQNNMTNNRTTQEDLYQFYKSEAEIESGQPIPQGRRKRK